MAEALLRHIDSKNFEAVSATQSSQELHPLSIEIMNEVGVDLDHARPAIIDDLRGQTFDFMITLDETAAGQQHPVTALDTAHWKLGSPLTLSSEQEVQEPQRRALRSIRDQIAQRLRLFAIVHTRENFLSSQTRFAEAAAGR
jgi:protein-tyrosine-phosphatase